MKKFLMIFLTVCMVVSCMIVPSFAAGGTVDDIKALGFKPIKINGYDWACMIIYKEGGVYRGFASDYTGLNFTYNGTSGVVDVTSGSTNLKDCSLSLVTYSMNDSGEYVFSGYDFSQHSNTSFSINPDVNSIVYSYWDIYDENGELFFPREPLTLSQTVEELTMEQSMAVQNQTVKMMKILVPCGVGCLALLMALPTLRKGFLRFLH